MTRLKPDLVRDPCGIQSHRQKSGQTHPSSGTCLGPSTMLSTLCSVFRACTQPCWMAGVVPIFWVRKLGLRKPHTGWVGAMGRIGTQVCLILSSARVDFGRVVLCWAGTSTLGLSGQQERKGGQRPSRVGRGFKAEGLPVGWKTH